MGLLLLTVLAATPCPPTGDLLLVLTAEHRLLLCEGGVERQTYPVAIGSGGPTSGRVAWAQTPLGRFALLAPRRSTQFHTFIPLENPAPRRFSAWAIGLHGPPRDTKDEGALNVETDWTWGCIALASDGAIDEVAAWVRRSAVHRVEFR